MKDKDSEVSNINDLFVHSKLKEVHQLKTDARDLEELRKRRNERD